MPTSQFVPPADEPPSSPLETRRDLLAATKRGFAPVRHSFVQRRRENKRPRAVRAATLAGLVRDHQERAFDAYLAVLALEPILGEHEPLHSAVWCRLLSDASLPVASISRIWAQLRARKLITKERRAGHALVRPRREDGRAAYTRPGRAVRDASTGGWPRNDWYFVVPHAYWLDGWDQKLSLPGKAMLLISLQATSKNPSYWMRMEDAPIWYGVSAETAHRGLAELERHGLLQRYHQKIKAPKSPTGFTTRIHYTLATPFSTASRRVLQTAAARAFRAKAMNAGDEDLAPDGQAATRHRKRGTEARSPSRRAAVDATAGRAAS